MHILLAEDEKKVAGFISKALKESGYTVKEVHHGDEAFQLASTHVYDLIIMDIMMPGRDGLSVLRLLRQQRIFTPVLILTARGEVSERIEGLHLGADDYMAKPFSMGELLARVIALIRRSSPDRSTVLQIRDLSLNLVTREVIRANQSIHLTVREFSLLEYLMRMPEHVHTRTSLCEHIWGYHFDTDTNVVDVYIQRLRRKVDDGYDIKLIHAVRGVGYVLRKGEE